MDDITTEALIQRMAKESAELRESLKRMTNDELLAEVEWRLASSYRNGRAK